MVFLPDLFDFIAKRPQLINLYFVPLLQLRAMLTRSLQVIREGYTAATWRAGALHACAVLWWEKGGVAVKPRNFHPAAVRALPPPGDILGTFYRLVYTLGLI